MRVLVSAQYLRLKNVGGTEQYLKNLLAGIAHATEHDLFTIVANHETIEQMRATWSLPANTDLVPIGRYAGPVRSILEQLFVTPGLVNRLHPDLAVFPTHYTPYMVAPAIGTIHDMQHLHYPEYFSRSQMIWRRFSHYTTIKNSTRVITISHFTAEDAVRYFGHQVESKIRVIHNAIDTSRFQENEVMIGQFKASVFDFKAPYILAVCTAYPHKNLVTLIKSFALKKQELMDHKLMLVGRGFKPDSSLSHLVNELGISSQVIYSGFVEDALLGTLYRHASVFVHPSLFEGFGMPPVEALLLGCPVITTKLTSLPEVTHGYAQYVNDPKDPQELGDMIVEVLRNQAKYRPNEAQVSMLQEAYNPIAIARQHLEVFHEAAM